MKPFARFFLAFALPILCSQVSNAQDSWTKKADFGGVARIYSSYFSIGNSGYVGAGDTANSNTSLPIVSDFWAYNSDSNKWTRKADIPLSSRIGAFSFSIGNKGFVGCGDGGNDFWEYDPARNSWTRKADVPGSSRLYPISFSIGGKGYVGMGFVWGIGNILNDFWEYDTLSNKWTRKSNFGGLPKCYAVGFSVGNKGFAGTGLDSTFATSNPNQAYNDFWEYDPAKDKWTQKASIGLYGRYSAIGFGMLDMGYLGFGFVDSTGIENDIWAYDTASNQWTQMSYCDPSYATISPFAFSIGNKGFVGSGEDDNGAFRKDFYQYTNHTAGIEKPSYSTDFDIYPDPNSGNFTLTSTYPIEYQVCDINGRQIYRSDIGTETFSANINLKLPNGIYLLKAISQKGISVKKFVVSDN